jgi:hypothetical protein
MKHGLKNIAAGGAALALLFVASAGAANASYLGYGNGDPGNWGFYDELHPHHAKAHASNVHRTSVHHRYASGQERKHS